MRLFTVVLLATFAFLASSAQPVPLDQDLSARADQPPLTPPSSPAPVPDIECDKCRAQSRKYSNKDVPTCKKLRDRVADRNRFWIANHQIACRSIGIPHELLRLKLHRITTTYSICRNIKYSNLNDLVIPAAFYIPAPSRQCISMSDRQGWSMPGQGWCIHEHIDPEEICKDQPDKSYAGEVEPGRVSSAGAGGVRPANPKPWLL